MIITQAIKNIMKDKKVTQGEMAGRLDERFKSNDKEVIKRGQSFISSKFRTDNWSVDSVIEFLDELGYELVVKPKQRGKRSESEYLIESSKTKEV